MPEHECCECVERLRGRETVWHEMEQKYSDALNEVERLRITPSAQAWSQVSIHAENLQRERDSLREALEQIAKLKTPPLEQGEEYVTWRLIAEAALREYHEQRGSR